LTYFSSEELFSYLENGECLDVSGVRDVGTTAEIDQGTASIYCTLGSVGNTLVDEVKLVFAVLEHLNKLFLGHLETLKWLFLLDDGARNVLQRLLILFGNDLAAKSVSTDLYQ
jgi:UDP:flavonoid glycosyltransferase YjiC (YdhE family)